MTCSYSARTRAALTQCGRPVSSPSRWRSSGATSCSAARMNRSRSSCRKPLVVRAASRAAGQPGPGTEPSAWPARRSRSTRSCSGPLRRVGAGSPRERGGLPEQAEGEGRGRPGERLARGAAHGRRHPVAHPAAASRVGARSSTGPRRARRSGPGRRRPRPRRRLARTRGPEDAERPPAVGDHRLWYGSRLARRQDRGRAPPAGGPTRSAGGGSPCGRFHHGLPTRARQAVAGPPCGPLGRKRGGRGLRGRAAGLRSRPRPQGARLSTQGGGGCRPAQGVMALDPSSPLGDGAGPGRAPARAAGPGHYGTPRRRKSVSSPRNSRPPSRPIAMSDRSEPSRTSRRIGGCAEPEPCGRGGGGEEVLPRIRPLVRATDGRDRRSLAAECAVRAPRDRHRLEPLRERVAGRGADLLRRLAERRRTSLNDLGRLDARGADLAQRNPSTRRRRTTRQDPRAVAGETSSGAGPCGGHPGHADLTRRSAAPTPHTSGPPRPRAHDVGEEVAGVEVVGAVDERGRKARDEVEGVWRP